VISNYSRLQYFDCSVGDEEQTIVGYYLAMFLKVQFAELKTTLFFKAV
jgi:hypothetical protein